MRSVCCHTPEYDEALHQIPNGRWDGDLAAVWKELSGDSPYPKRGGLGVFLQPPVTETTGLSLRVMTIIEHTCLCKGSVHSTWVVPGVFGLWHQGPWCMSSREVLGGRESQCGVCGKVTHRLMFDGVHPCLIIIY